MKKLSLFWAPVLLVLLLFSGCLEYTQDGEINRDGSGEMKIRYSFSGPDMQKRELAGQYDTLNIRREHTNEAYTFKKISSGFDEKGNWFAEIEIAFKNVNDLSKAKMFNRFEFNFTDGAAGQYKFTQYIRPPSDLNKGGRGFDETFYYRFDGEVVSHNAQKVEGDTYIWHFALNEIGDGKYIEATFAPAPPFNYFYLIAGCVVVVIAAVWVLIKRKMKKESTAEI